MRKFSHGCTLDCFDCCKFNVYTKDQQITQIEGDAQHPYTKGFICAKGKAHLSRLTHPERLLTPRLKVNGTWQAISFEKALDLMSEKLQHYLQNFGAHSILYYEQYGNGALLKSIGNLFFNFLGGALEAKGGPCWSAGIAAQKQDFGDIKSHSLEDMLNSQTIVVWGKNPAYTTIHTMQMLRKAKAKGIFIIVIDPIYTKTAQLADLYIQVKPNGDGALALAIGKMILESHLEDSAYLKAYTHGFDAYQEALAQLSLSELCEVAGVTLEQVQSFVTHYTKKYASMLLGYGMQKYAQGGQVIRLIDALGALTGQIGFSGGGINYANRVYPDILNTDPYNSTTSSESYAFYTSHLSDLIEAAVVGKAHYEQNLFVPYPTANSQVLETPLKMAVITKSNLLNQLPDLNRLKKAFSQIEFKVCFEHFMTDTAEACDLVLPATSSLESEDLLYSSMTNPYLIYNEQILEPAHPLMDEYEFFKVLAQRLHLTAYPQVDKKTYLEQVIAPLKAYCPEMSLDYLKTNYFTLHEAIAWENKAFKTPSGKFEMVTPALTQAKAQPNHLRLLTNHGQHSLSSQHYLEETSMTLAYLHPETAKKYKVGEGEQVYLKTATNSLEVCLKLDETIHPSTVMIYVGWWQKHGNPNILTTSGLSDIGGQVTYNESFVELMKK